MNAAIRLVLPGPGAAPSRLPRFVVVSLVAHLVFSSVVIFAPRFSPTPSMPETAWAVELVSAAPAPPPPASPAPQRAATPAPRREPPPAEPKPKPVVESRPRPVAVDQPPRRRDPPKSTTPAMTTPRPSAGPDESSPEDPLPGEPSGAEAPSAAGDESASVTALDVADFRYAWYRDAVTASLYASWRKPVLAGRVEPLEVRVEFEIGRDGSVSAVRVAGPSGLSSLDRSALRAVADAAPFPRLPGGWGGSTLPAAFVFRLFPD